MNYDRKYDMGCVARQYVQMTSGPKYMLDLMMRGPRLELGCLSAPDPKSRAIEANPFASQCVPATERHGTPPSAIESTTKSTTDANAGLRRFLSDLREDR